MVLLNEVTMQLGKTKAREEHTIHSERKGATLYLNKYTYTSSTLNLLPMYGLQAIYAGISYDLHSTPK